MAEFVDEVQQLERKSNRLNNWVALFIGLAVLSFVTGLALTCHYQQLAYFVIGCLFVATFISSVAIHILGLRTHGMT